MKEFIENLISRLEEEKKMAYNTYMNYEMNVDIGRAYGIKEAIEIVNQLAEEYNNDFCEWEYDDFEDGWQTSCGTTFSLCDSDKEITHYCPCCGKKIKVVE